jgi:hypothetical protein
MVSRFRAPQKSATARKSDELKIDELDAVTGGKFDQPARNFDAVQLGAVQLC